VLLRNARIVLPERTTENASLLIRHNLIERIQESPDQLFDEVTIDLAGCTLYPGFIDVHIHGAVGVDANDSSSDGLQRLAQFLLHHGVTGWLPTLVPDSGESYRRAISAIDRLALQQKDADNRQTNPGARVLGVHYEGPFVSEHQCGALRSQFFKSFVNGDELKSLPRLATARAAHLITLAPEVAGGIDLIKALVKEDWIVSLGHTRASIDILEKARAAGARHMTHFLNAMPPLHHRAPGPVGWGLSQDEVTCDLIADGEHIDPLVLRLLMKVKGAARLALISDSIAAAGLGDGDYNIWDETITVTNGRTSNARGSIAGSVITMLDAVRRMLSQGASEVDVATMAATNPARLLKIDSECGSIEVGKRADLVALDSAGQVRLTIMGGEIAWRAL